MSNTYTTTQGDAWDMIAYKVWGDEMLVAFLLAANPAYKDTYFFEAGVVLTLPDIDTSATSDPVPPWQS